jgi:hypothetical protein
MSLDIQMLVWYSLFACERNSEQHCTAWKVKSAESTKNKNDLKTGFQSMQGRGSGGNCSGCCEVNLSLF